MHLRLHAVTSTRIYRTEHHVIDAPLVRIFEYADDGTGHCMPTPDGQDLVHRPPYDVPILTDPPRLEDYVQ